MSNKYIHKETHIFDIDGTLILQPDGPEGFDLNAPALDGAVEKLNKLKADGHCIVIVTARDEYYWAQTAQQLSTLGIPWDKLLCGIGSGKRFVWNNEKSTTKDTAEGIVVEKNKGLRKYI
jgi:hydroxymethylpyrimidine pyrophosphatase-like HAD family hydrolase